MTDIHVPSLRVVDGTQTNVCQNCGKLLNGVLRDELCDRMMLGADYLTACAEWGLAAGNITPRQWSFNKNFQLYILMRICGRIGFWGAAEHIRDDLLKRGIAQRLIVITLCLFATSAQAQTWRPIAKQCAEIVTNDLHRQTGCANCSDSWPLWAECTVKTIYRDAIPKEHIDVCVSRTKNERSRTGACSACGDPVASTLACLGIH
jgi:hypothetical protein